MLYPFFNPFFFFFFFKFLFTGWGWKCISTSRKVIFGVLWVGSLQQTYQNRLNLTQSVEFGQFLRVGGLGWAVDFFFTMVRVGFRSKNSKILLTRLNPPIFNIYLNLKKYYIYIYKYIIHFCYLFFCPLFLNKIQILSSPNIVCVSLMLCSWLFDYKLAIIYDGVVLMFNLIIIIVIKNRKLSNHEANPIYVTWVEPYDKLG